MLGPCQMHVYNNKKKGKKMKKIISLNEEIKRMKSLMGEERLYGNLVDSPLEKKIITEGFPIPWRTLLQALKAGAKESPELITSLSRSYIGKINKALSKIPESGIIPQKQAQEIMNIAKGIPTNTVVRDNITKLFKLSKINLNSSDISNMRTMLVNTQALILRGVAKGENATQIAKDINKINGSNTLTAQDITDFAHLVFNSPNINKILGESKLAKSLENLNVGDKEAYFKILTKLIPSDLRGIDDFKNIDGGVTKEGFKALLDGSWTEQFAKKMMWGWNFTKKGLKTLFIRFDVPPITRWIEKWGWGKTLMRQKLITGKWVSLANAPIYAGFYSCWVDGFWPWWLAYQKKKAGEVAVDEVDWNASVSNAAVKCLNGLVVGSSTVIPRGIAYVTKPVLDKVYDYEKSTIKDLFRKWLIIYACEQTGSKKVVDGELSCDWAAVQALYPNCESLKGDNGPIEEFKKEAIEQKWYLKVLDYTFKSMGIDEGITGFKEMIEEELTNDPQLCEWFADNLQLEWKMTEEELRDQVEDMVEAGAVDTDVDGDGIIINDIKTRLIKTGMQCNYLLQWKQAVLTQAKRDSGEYDKYGDGKEGFKTWWCNYKYGEGTAYSKEAAIDYISACKKAVDKWCP